ncbi:hypothetical protein EVG20_g2761 [Dentipellis fragilis]|uniref:Uncharacterized protein n=1 Tax=Dentipellis fragilis TaxID=205917 RepID=A0A4Y9Z6V0_9AGAM|nr:hypothetical protein EVG20_g2761 [Dentipellis fragilis]
MRSRVMSESQTRALAPAKAYVRLARKDELNDLADMARRAFISDPIYNYSGNLKEPLSNDTNTSKRRTLQKFQRLLIGSSMAIGARTTVVAVPVASEGSETNRGKEELAAVCIWSPEGKHLDTSHPFTLLRNGFLGILTGWGITGLKRIALEYSNSCDKAWKEIRKSEDFKADATNGEWYVQMVCTAPEHQGKGYLSLIMREMFEYAPNQVLTLDASTPKSRDRYAHLGFELKRPWGIGKGKADSRGFKAKGDAPGMEFYAMVKILPQTTIQHDFPVVLKDIHSGTVPAESFWVSFYKQGEPSIHGKVHCTLDETDPRRDRITMQPRDGVEFDRLHEYRYTASCLGLSIPSTAIVLPSQVYADPDHSDEIHPHQIPTFAVSAPSASSSFQILATGYQAGTVSLYTLDPSSSKPTYAVSPRLEIKPFASSRLHKSTPTALLLLPPNPSHSASNLLVSAGLDFTIHLTPITTPRVPTAAPTAPAELTPSASLKAHTRAVTSLLALSPSSLVSGGKDGALRFWDLNTAQQTAVVASTGLSPVTALAGSESDAYAATQSGVVERFDVRTRASVARTEKSGVAVSALAVDGDAHAVVAGGIDGVVRVWDVRALGQERARWKRSGGSIEGAAILPSPGPDASLKVLVGGEDGLPYIARLGDGDGPNVSVETELVFGDVEAVRCVRLSKGVNGEDEVWMSGDGGVVRRYAL